MFDFEEEEDGLDAGGLDLHKRRDDQSNTRVPGGGGKMELTAEMAGKVEQGGWKEAQHRTEASSPLGEFKLPEE